MDAAHLHKGPSEDDLELTRIESHISKLLRAKRLGQQVSAHREDIENDATPEKKRKPRSSRKHKTYVKDGIPYASLSNRVCTELMEKYISWFKIVPGQTYEIPFAKEKSGGIMYADFRVGNAFVEFHKPRYWLPGRYLGDFKSLKQKKLCRRAVKNAPPGRKKEIKRIVCEMLMKNYEEKRLHYIAQSPEHSRRDLIVVSSPEEFYEKVIKKFANRPIPSQESFVAEWGQIMERLKFEVGYTNKKPRIRTGSTDLEDNRQKFSRRGKGGKGERKRDRRQRKRDLRDLEDQWRKSA